MTSVTSELAATVFRPEYELGVHVQGEQPSMRDEAELHVLYEAHIESLSLVFKSGAAADVSHALVNGRANYILFERLVGDILGLGGGVQGAGSDLVDAAGSGYEVKAFKDAQIHPGVRDDLLQTSASSTFSANNRGPEIRDRLNAGDYAGALAICRATGYDRNEFYVYTNTRQFNPSVPLRFIVVPTSYVLSHLSPDDPRLISRADLLNSAIRSEAVPETWLPT